MSKNHKINDLWNAYQYGDKIKVVYIKAATRRKKTVEALFSEFDGLPENLRALAIHSTVYGGNVVSSLSEVDLPEAAPQDLGAEWQDTEERLAASISRTKSRIYELAMCNEFTHFCTFTQDQTKVKDRFDLEAFQRDFSHYVRNQNRGRADKIRYLLIPEQHKDGAWHLHGFLSGLKVGEDLTEFTLKDHIPYRLRKMIKNGEKVYNWGKYAQKYGYFTATEVKNKSAASAYICKYVTKDVAKQGREAGRHLFFASQGLNGRERVIHDCRDQSGEVVKCPIADDEWDFENEYVKIKWVDEITENSNGKVSRKTDTEI